MIVIEIKWKKAHYVDALHQNATFPRFPRKNFTGVYFRDLSLEIVKTIFKNLPMVPSATEVYFPGELGLFVYINFIHYLIQTNDQIKKDIQKSVKES